MNSQNQLLATDSSLIRNCIRTSVVASVASACFVYLYFGHSAFLGWLTREDSVAEYLSALLYLVAAGLFFVIWVRHGLKHLFVLGYALLFLFVGGEEISWGQRIFGLQTPEELRAINVQGETNLHNIDGLHQHIRAVGLVVVFMIAFLMPLLDRFVPVFQNLFRKLAIPVVPLWTIPLTVFAVAFMAVPRLLGNIDFKLDEIGELYLSITFVLFAFASRDFPARAPYTQQLAKPITPADDVVLP